MFTIEAANAMLDMEDERTDWSGADYITALREHFRYKKPCNNKPTSVPFCVSGIFTLCCARQPTSLRLLDASLNKLSQTGTLEQP